jgi:hypothetical protein
VVWIPLGQKKIWHGAPPDSSLPHIAIQESLEGKTVVWMGQVSEEQYQGNRCRELILGRLPFASRLLNPPKNLSVSMIQVRANPTASNIFLPLDASRSSGKLVTTN